MYYPPKPTQYLILLLLLAFAVAACQPTATVRVRQLSSQSNTSNVFVPVVSGPETSPVAVPAVAQEVELAAPVEPPIIGFIIPINGATVTSPFRVIMAAQNFTIEPAGEIRENAGHFHIMVNTDCLPAGEIIPADEAHLHYGQGQTEVELELPPGDYTLCLQAADGSHAALPLTQTINIAVEASPQAEAATTDSVEETDAPEGAEPEAETNETEEETEAVEATEEPETTEVVEAEDEAEVAEEAEEVAEILPGWPLSPALLPAGDTTNGAVLYTTLTCNVCHGQVETEGTNVLGPWLGDLAERGGSVIEGYTAADYMYESVLLPSAYIVKECPTGPCAGPPSVMIPNFGETVSQQDLADLMSYILGTPTFESNR